MLFSQNCIEYIFQSKSLEPEPPTQSIDSEVLRPQPSVLSDLWLLTSDLRY